jgi:hypothetical protein
MSQVSRPMQIALAVTLLFAMLWFVALRPKPGDGGGEAAPPPASPPAAQVEQAPGTEGLSNAVDQAEEAVATANGAPARREAAGGAAAGGEAVQSSAPAARATGTRSGGAGSRAAARDVVAGGPVGVALRQKKAVAIAFVDPRTADARAVREELRHVSRFGGRALALTVPISQLSRYEFITRGVEVTVAPTVVIVSPQRTATTIVGFADRVEIEQGLADALATRRGRR